MTISLAELEEQARSLTPEERARLAEVLLESLHGTALSDIEAAWQHEIEQRVSAYERGELETFSAEQVFAEAKHLTR
jgi:putative addiction module component (TIGR02574 family)